MFNKYQNKYHAQKTEYAGQIYDSKFEAERAFQLDMLSKAGEIHSLARQVKFLLQPGFTNSVGQKIREITYIADFVYIKDGKKVIEDTKGFVTKEFVIKKKLLQYKFPDYIFIERHKNKFQYACKGTGILAFSLSSLQLNPVLSFYDKPLMLLYVYK